MVIYRLVGEHGQLRRSTTGHLDSLGETLLMCARCAGAYHCKVPAQLPSSSGNDACPEDGVRTSKNPRCSPVKPSSISQENAVWMESGAGGLQERVRPWGQS